MLENHLKVAPTVDVRPTGKWSEFLKCSACGFYDDDFGIAQIIKCDFCPNCGAKMKGEDDAD